MKWLTDRALDRLRSETGLPDLEGTKYRMIRPIASGGMGEVYLVEDTSLDRRVALKVLNVVDPSEDLAIRMLREARVVARLEHPGIVPVHDVGTLSDGRVFFTMKFVEGERLDHFARGRRGALSELLRAFHKICEAVAFAHAHGVIHRDLKPENVMVGPFGEVLVMDWGIAKVLGDADLEQRSGEGAAGSMRIVMPGSDTTDGTVLGTPSYMSPEQSRGEPLDERTDIYPLGAILFLLLTGHPHAPGRNPRQIDPSIPRPLDAICMKSLAEQPAHRYDSVRSLADDIIRFLDGLPVSAYPENILERTGRFVRKNKFVVVLVVAYLVMRLVVFLVSSQ